MFFNNAVVVNCTFSDTMDETMDISTESLISAFVTMSRDTSLRCEMTVPLLPGFATVLEDSSLRFLGRQDRVTDY